ncbi:hypothetical protein MUY27_07245 [Mucilaginibacter sp. RS28]|uniref:Beta-lactamase-inhibitor-like PepSY-like domain-containing protein n=1 Tax=Mucilaginibacter straminoryzae TaxID=2932774 RepID=A0A9X1X1L0_9SPHI|nr:hypothetical protein [Mucilaginibacter straminoryzae]MCJ8209499.1 hypothetical protein [Mucilaginibacter straminoryzae]
MKKIILTAAVAVTLCTSAFAIDKEKAKAESKTSNVSYQALNQFEAQFSGAENVNWSSTNFGEKAEFVLDDVKMSAFYNRTGEFLGTTQAVAYKKLPSSAKKEIESRYKDYTVGEVIKYESAENTDGLDRLLGSVEPVAYFVDLKNNNEEIVVRVTPQAGVYYYTKLK